MTEIIYALAAYAYVACALYGMAEFCGGFGPGRCRWLARSIVPLAVMAGTMQ